MLRIYKGTLIDFLKESYKGIPYRFSYWESIKALLMNFATARRVDRARPSQNSNQVFQGFGSKKGAKMASPPAGRRQPWIWPGKFFSNQGKFFQSGKFFWQSMVFGIRSRIHQKTFCDQKSFSESNSNRNLGLNKTIPDRKKDVFNPAPKKTLFPNALYYLLVVSISDVT